MGNLFLKYQKNKFSNFILTTLLIIYTFILEKLNFSLVKKNPDFNSFHLKHYLFVRLKDFKISHPSSGRFKFRFYINSKQNPVKIQATKPSPV